MTPAATAPVLHGFSVDVEDWFHILEYAGAPDPSAWAAQEARVAVGTDRLLALLARHRIRATFFVLGWIAERHPEVVARIAAAGHELGSHGHLHRLVSHLDRDAFARDLDASLEAIERAAGRKAVAFRAPGFSIGPNEMWALAILVSRGINLDASLFLANRAHGGFRLDRTRPFAIVLPDGRSLTEVPTVPRRLAGHELPFSGGGYLRLLPAWFLAQGFASFEARGDPVVAYLHPREMDPDQPRMALPPLRKFKYYVGLNGVEAKLEALFTRFRFGCLGDVVAATRPDLPLHLDRRARVEAA